jgi:hypothetical protein
MKSCRPHKQRGANGFRNNLASRVFLPNISCYAESWNEGPIMIPYLSPEFIAAILGNDSATASDMRTDPKPAVENAVPVQRPHQPSIKHLCLFHLNRVCLQFWPN